MAFTKLRAMTPLLVTLAVSAPSVSNDSARTLPATSVTYLDQMIDAAAQEKDIIGQSVRILKNGKLVYSRDTGVEGLERPDAVDANTVFPVYSITKLYVATLVAKLRSDKQLDPDATIGTYLNGLPQTWQNMKLKTLLSHTSGLPEFFSIRREYSNDPHEIIASLKAQPLTFDVNSQVEYNQTNFMLIKMIIEKLYGDNLADIINNEFVSPLGLSRTFYRRGEDSQQGRVSSYYINEGGKIVDFGVPNFKPVMYAASGLQTSADNMARWAEALLSGQYLPESALTRTWQPQPLADGLFGQYSNGWQVQREAKATAVGHYGGNILNFRHFFLNDDPRQSVTIIHLTNGWGTEFFELFDFSYALAKEVEPQLSIGSVDLKHMVLAHAASGDMARMMETFEQFKKYAADQRMHAEMLVNSLGYQVLETAPEAAALLFKANLADHPNSANAHDSYAEALYRSGRYGMAKDHFQKAFAINPAFDHIPGILEDIDQAMKAAQ